MDSGWKIECKLLSDTRAVELQSNPGDQPSILVLSLPCTKVSLFLRGKICSSSSFRQKWTGSSVSDCLFNRETGQFGKKQAVIMVGTLKTDLLDEWRAVFCFVFAFCQLCFGHRPSGIMSIKHNLFKSANIYWLTSMYKELRNVLTVGKGGWYNIQGLLAIHCTRTLPGPRWWRSLRLYAVL